jgi:hypothetical protein
MYANPTNATATPISTKWEELTLLPKPDGAPLQQMEVKLDLLLLALKTLAEIGIDALGRVAAQLQLESVTADKLSQIGMVCGEIEKANSFSAYSSLPEEQQKAHKIDEGRSLVLIICHLARQHQPLIRRAVALIEQSASERSDTPALLKDYSDRLNAVYQQYRLTRTGRMPVLPEPTEKLAFKLLIDLLFYSDSGAHRRLWLTVSS